MARIQSYRFGHMVVDGEVYTRDLILLPDRVVANWWREEGHRLSTADLQEVVTTAPEVLVIGTGAYGMVRVPQETREALQRAGIEVHIARTGEAWQLYNELQERKRTAGAFHLTC
ncbi:MAG: Mth938-like domain-containing protein [Anaerolineae bacterium]|nr:Mth938-like domain-containing protein [Anaerolineae bacterium]